MLPLRIDEPTQRFPWATLGIALACGLAFVWSRSQPDEVLRPLTLDPAAFSPLQFLTSGLLHVNVYHLAGNLVFLLVFGIYVEDRTGPWRFLLLYLAFEIGGDLAFLAFSWAAGRDVASLGASSAISGVLGFTFAAIPLAKVVVVWYPSREGELPRAPVAAYLGIWIFFQVVFMLGTSYGGVAWAAHLGGFLTGVGLYRLLSSERLRSSAWHLERDPDLGSAKRRARRRTAALYRETAEALRAEHGGRRAHYVVPAQEEAAEPEASEEAEEAEEAAPERRPREDDWTLAEGVRATLGFLAVRLVFALPLAVLLEAGVLAPMSRVPGVGLLAAIFGIVMGMAIGTVVAWGLIRHVHFTGWVPMGLAMLAAAVAVFGGYALAAQWNPIDGEVLRPLCLGVLAIGAGGAIYRFTGLD